jgi:hypothetical protein
VRKPYTRFPLDTPHPAFKGEKAMWEPRMMVRVGKGHATTPRFLAVIDSGSPYCMLQVPGILGRKGFFDNFYVNFDHASNPPSVEVKKIDKTQ